MNAIVSPEVAPELLAAGFDWSEGPVWIADGAFLLFSDVPQNRMYRWAEGDTAATIFLDPSGLTSSDPWTGSGGSNGLTLDADGYLVIAQHGDRRVSRLDQKPGQLRSLGQATFTTIADRFQGNRLQSPNDVVFGPNGDLYFTDPPYGLEGGDDSELRELEFNGVYRVSADGEVHLLDDLLSRPNGIAFSPDGKTMYVSNSDPDYAVWIAYDVDDGGSVANRRVFFDASSWTATKPGLPDGLKVDSLGNIFATGPGGVLVFAPDGRHVGTIVTGTAVANCAFGDDGRTLYMTSDDYLTRIRVLTGAS
jgi:gluconolactonase